MAITYSQVCARTLLQFSELPDSGGEEGVLVVWQVSTGHKRFLPRLGLIIIIMRFPPVTFIRERAQVGDGQQQCFVVCDRLTRQLSSHSR